MFVLYNRDCEKLEGVFTTHDKVETKAKKLVEKIFSNKAWGTKVIPDTIVATWNNKKTKLEVLCSIKEQGSIHRGGTTFICKEVKIDE